MKQTILTALIFMLAITTYAQPLGTERTDVLKQWGTPSDIQDNRLFYITDKREVLIFDFLADELISKSATKPYSWNRYKGHVSKLITQYGQPNKADVEGNMVYTIWKQKSEVMVFAFDRRTNYVTMLIIDVRFHNIRKF